MRVTSDGVTATGGDLVPLQARNENMAETNDPVLVLRGTRVALGPLREDLVPTYHRWEQQLVALAGLGHTTPETLESRRTTYGLASQGGDLGAYFTVYATNGETWQPIGLSTLHIDQRKQVANYVILLGERRGEGLGTEATKLTLDWASTSPGCAMSRWRSGNGRRARRLHRFGGRATTPSVTAMARRPFVPALNPLAT
jgi:RimJ/RimL family protein N-acetyltransferase